MNRRTRNGGFAWGGTGRRAPPARERVHRKAFGRRCRGAPDESGTRRVHRRALAGTAISATAQSSPAVTLDGTERVTVVESDGLGANVEVVTAPSRWGSASVRGGAPGGGGGRVLSSAVAVIVHLESPSAVAVNAANSSVPSVLVERGPDDRITGLVEDERRDAAPGCRRCGSTRRWRSQPPAPFRRRPPRVPRHCPGSGDRRGTG